MKLLEFTLFRFFAKDLPSLIFFHLQHHSDLYFIPEQDVSVASESSSESTPLEEGEGAVLQVTYPGSGHVRENASFRWHSMSGGFDTWLQVFSQSTTCN